MEIESTINASDPEVVAARRQIVDSRRQRDQLELRAMLKTPEARRFLGSLVYGICGLKRLSIQGDQGSTEFNEGTRNVGLQVLGMIEEVDFAASLLIQREREEERQLELLKSRPRPTDALDPAPRDYSPTYADK